MDKEKINIIISLLQKCYEKPGRYFSDYSECVGFAQAITHICLGFDLLPIELQIETHRQVAKELGWEYIANSPAQLLRELDWREEDKINELLKIEIAAWQRMLNIIENHE